MVRRWPLPGPLSRDAGLTNRVAGGCLRGRRGVTAGQLFTSDAEEHLWSTLQDCYQSAGIRDRYVNPPHEVCPDRVPRVGQVDVRKKC